MIRNNVRGPIFNVSPENAFFGAGRYPAIWLFSEMMNLITFFLIKKIQMV